MKIKNRNFAIIGAAIAAVGILGSFQKVDGALYRTLLFVVIGGVLFFLSTVVSPPSKASPSQKYAGKIPGIFSVTDFDEKLKSIPQVAVAQTETVLKKLSVADLSNLTYTNVTIKSNKEQISNFVVVDIETTGLKANSDAIIEVSAIRYEEFEPVSLFTSLVCPPFPIPKDVTKINSITDDMVAQAPTFSRIAESLSEFIAGYNIIGHNLPFDLKFLYHNGIDVLKKKRKYYDTLALAQSILRGKEVSNYKLDTLCKHYRIYRNDAHRSSSDCLATAMLFEKLVKEKL